MEGVEVRDTDSESSKNGVVLFGKYELLELLGVGASAKVYHARRVDTGESVAVKAVSKRNLRNGNSYAAQVEREVAIMRRLRHPHTVRIYEVLATKTKIYFVMEFAAGGELHRRVATSGRMSENVARRYFQQLISAVRYCHSSGVYHRDLKLENLLIDENMDLKVSDFGLSASRAETRPDGLFHTVCGTPAYVAPEILARKGYDGASVDVWSCGVVLFALVAGYLPFNDYNLTVLYRKIYRGQFRFPKWVSRDFRNLVTRMLDPNPKTRITVEGIMNDSWFNWDKFDQTRVQTKNKDDDQVITKNEDEDQVMIKTLNAFDLILFSSGLDISGILIDSEDLDCIDRFILGESSRKVVEKVEEAAKMKNVVVKKEESGCGGVSLEGMDGNFVIIVRVHQLTNELVLVEVKRKERGLKSGGGEEFWNNVLGPLFLALASKPTTSLGHSN